MIKFKTPCLFSQPARQTIKVNEETTQILFCVTRIRVGWHDKQIADINIDQNRQRVEFMKQGEIWGPAKFQLLSNCNCPRYLEHNTNEFVKFWAFYFFSLKQLIIIQILTQTKMQPLIISVWIYH